MKYADRIFTIQVQIKTDSHHKQASSHGMSESNIRLPRSAYIYFVAEHRDALRAEHPEWEFGDVARELSKQWKELPDLNKRLFLIQAEQDKLRCEAEIIQEKLKTAEPHLSKENSTIDIK